MPDPYCTGRAIPREMPLALCLTSGALLYLGVHVIDHLFEDDIDPGTLVPNRAFAEVFAAALALIDFDNLNSFYGACVARASVVVGLTLAFGARSGGRGIALFGLGGRQARVAVVFGGALFHEHGNQNLKQHQHGLEQGAAFFGHLAVTTQLLEPSPSRCRTLPVGIVC